MRHTKINGTSNLIRTIYFFVILMSAVISNSMIKKCKNYFLRFIFHLFRKTEGFFHPKLGSRFR